MMEESKEIFTYHKSIATINNTIMMLGQEELEKNKGYQYRMQALLKMNTMYAIALKADDVQNRDDDALIMEDRYFHDDAKRKDGMYMGNLPKAFYIMVKKQVIAGLIPSADLDFTPQSTYGGIHAALQDKRG